MFMLFSNKTIDIYRRVVSDRGSVVRGHLQTCQLNAFTYAGNKTIIILSKLFDKMESILIENVSKIG